MAGGEPKKYGLILPSKKTTTQASVPSLVKKPSIFDDEDDSDFQKGTSSGDILQRNGYKSLWKKETQIQLQKALEEDPNAFEYDSVFDQMEKKKIEVEARTKGTNKDDRKPKYVQALLATAKERDLEFQRRLERKNQRERETEGGEFADKEAFVTSAYRKKMEEMREAEAREKEMDKIEAKLDVTKQANLNGFYRNLLKQTTGEQKVRNAGESFGKPEVKSESSSRSEEKKRERSPTTDLAKKIRLDINMEEPPSPEAAEIVENFVEPEVQREISPEQIDSEKKKSAPVDLDELARIRAEAKKQELEKKAALFVKRTTEDSVSSARERYLARQAAKLAEK